MKGCIVGVACGLLAALMWSTNHQFLAMIAMLPLPVVVLAFWTGAVGVRWE